MSKPILFLDNDETLQCHARLTEPATHPYYLCMEDKDYNKERPFLVVFPRPGVQEMLSSLRENFSLKMLTFSVRSSALTLNKLCEFGFAEKDIFAREDMLGTPHLTTEYPRPHVSKQFPNSFLLDDQVSYSGHLECKLRFLGIGLTNYLRCNPLYPTTREEEYKREADYTKQLVKDINDEFLLSIPR